MQFLSKFYIGYLFYSLIIILGLLCDKLSFGLGLGDLGMIIIFAGLLIFISAYVIWRVYLKKEVSYWDFVVIGIMLTILIYFTLSLTIWRGVEKPWNGNIFI